MIIIFFLNLVSCGSENNESAVPEVVTLQATVIQFSGVTLRGAVSNTGDTELTARGFCYGESGFDIRDNCEKVDSDQLGEFELLLDDLPPQSTFEYEAFARNSNGTEFGTRLTFTTGEQADWKLISEVDFEELNSINFINEMEGWIAGNNGKIFKSTDGGRNWIENRLRLPEDIIDNSFKKIHFKDQSNGWIVGSEGTLYFTNNADTGLDWDTSRNSAHQDVVNVEVVDDSLIVIRSPSELVLSTNGGMDWLYFNLSFTGGPESLYPSLTFPERNTLVVGNASTLFISNDLGENWNDITPEFLDKNGSEIEIILQSVFFLNDSNGWIIANFNEPNEITPDGFIAFTENRGEDWEIIFKDSDNDKISENTRKIYFIDETNGFILEGLLRTMDGGLTWQKSTSIANDLDDIYFLNSENIWGISDSKIFKYSN
ncbi:MAG TPA: YCF48-related protein [Balneolaceae bacterium]|nr:YCF48-related protein [Balneolaceae bacterium]